MGRTSLKPDDSYFETFVVQPTARPYREFNRIYFRSLETVMKFHVKYS